MTDHREFDASLDQDQILRVNQEKIELCREMMERWISLNNPEIGTDGKLTKADYRAARVYVAREAAVLLGHPVTTGAVRHWFPRWGYYYTASQKAKKEAFEAARSKAP